MKRKSAIFSILAVSTLIAVGIWMKGNLAVDRCLDSGGCWDEMGKTCRKDEPNAQEPCDPNR